jgi:hypothetical protein
VAKPSSERTPLGGCAVHTVPLIGSLLYYLIVDLARRVQFNPFARLKQPRAGCLRSPTRSSRTATDNSRREDLRAILVPGRWQPGRIQYWNRICRRQRLAWRHESIVRSLKLVGTCLCPMAQVESANDLICQSHGNSRPDNCRRKGYLGTHTEWPIKVYACCASSRESAGRWPTVDEDRAYKRTAADLGAYPQRHRPRTATKLAPVPKIPIARARPTNAWGWLSAMARPVVAAVRK